MRESYLARGQGDSPLNVYIILRQSLPLPGLCALFGKMRRLYFTQGGLFQLTHYTLLGFLFGFFFLLFILIPGS